MSKILVKATSVKISTLVRICAFLFSEVVNILIGYVQCEQLKHIFCYLVKIIFIVQIRYTATLTNLCAKPYIYCKVTEGLCDTYLHQEYICIQSIFPFCLVCRPFMSAYMFCCHILFALNIYKYTNITTTKYQHLSASFFFA